jgi:hypothetical protein
VGSGLDSIAKSFLAVQKIFPPGLNIIVDIFPARIRNSSELQGTIRNSQRVVSGKIVYTAALDPDHFNRRP